MTDMLTQVQTPTDDTRLAHFPVTFFASAMGLAGFALALHKAETVLNTGHLASLGAVALAILVFVLIASLFGVKVWRHSAAVKAEWHHPVTLAFFPAISISMLLLATALVSVLPPVALWLWVAGTAAQGVLTLAVLSGWIGKRSFQPMHISPAWFIPAVGNVVVPLAGVQLGFVETSWLFFSAGLLFWIVLLTLVMNRLIFHDPLPERLYPTLAILIAPPAVAFTSWLNLNGGVLDPMARVLFGITLTFAALVLTQVPSLARLPFAISWWALSFPVAALSIATLTYGALADSAAHTVSGIGVVALLTAIIIGLVLRTSLAIRRGQICRPG